MFRGARGARVGEAVAPEARMVVVGDNEGVEGLAAVRAARAVLRRAHVAELERALLRVVAHELRELREPWPADRRSCPQKKDKPSFPEKERTPRPRSLTRSTRASSSRSSETVGSKADAALTCGRGFARTEARETPAPTSSRRSAWTMASR